MNAAGNFPVGAEIIPQAPPTDGAAPWERAGGGHHAPDDPAAQARARKWQEVAGEMSAADAEVSQARAERQAARARKKEEAAAKAAQNLEDTAVRMFRIGFAALPFVWLVSLLYFRKEMKNPEANPRIKKYVHLSGIMLVIYTLIFVGWVVAYQVWSGRTTGLLSMSILKGNLSLA